eukprot:Rmarinus@m.9746
MQQQYPPPNSGYATAIPQTETMTHVVQPVHGAWSFGLFDCFSNFPLCFLTTCCGCVRWAQTMQRADIMPYSAALVRFLLFAIAFHAMRTASMFDKTGLTNLVVFVIGVAFAAYLAQYRGRLRQKFGIQGSGFKDFCIMFWCGCCAVIQEARHTDYTLYGQEGGCEFEPYPKFLGQGAGAGAGQGAHAAIPVASASTAYTMATVNTQPPPQAQYHPQQPQQYSQYPQQPQGQYPPPQAYASQPPQANNPYPQPTPPDLSHTHPPQTAPVNPMYK